MVNVFSRLFRNNFSKWTFSKFIISIHCHHVYVIISFYDLFLRHYHIEDSEWERTYWGFLWPGCKDSHNIISGGSFFFLIPRIQSSIKKGVYIGRWTWYGEIYKDLLCFIGSLVNRGVRKVIFTMKYHEINGLRYSKCHVQLNWCVLDHMTFLRDTII